MGAGDKPGRWNQRNWSVAVQRSWLAKSCLSVLIVVLLTVILFHLTKRQIVVIEQAQLQTPEPAKAELKAKFSGDDFLKFHAGDESVEPGHQTLIRYISHHIGGPSYKWLNLTDDKRYDYSQYKVSTFVDQLLKERTEGFFLECGAGDGETNSRTLFFEKKRQWQGFLIEANPWSYFKLLFKRRKAFTVNACANPTNRAKKMLFRSAGLRGGLHGATDPKHLEAFKEHPEYLQDVEVQCFPIHSIMVALGVDTIDYMALDTHGAELDILKTIPFDKVNINVISIQYRITHPSTDTVDADATDAYLANIRRFFDSTEIYTEVGILPKIGATQEEIDNHGVEVIFMKTSLL